MVLIRTISSIASLGYCLEAAEYGSDRGAKFTLLNRFRRPDHTVSLFELCGEMLEISVFIISTT